MSMRPSNSLYFQVVEITHVYLGSAAERFIARQVQNHLNKEPDELSQDDLRGLIDWVRIAVSLLTEDTAIVETYIDQLSSLAQQASPVKVDTHATH